MVCVEVPFGRLGSVRSLSLSRWSLVALDLLLLLACGDGRCALRQAQGAVRDDDRRALECRSGGSGSGAPTELVDAFPRRSGAVAAFGVWWWSVCPSTGSGSVRSLSPSRCLTSEAAAVCVRSRSTAVDVSRGTLWRECVLSGIAVFHVEHANAGLRQTAPIAQRRPSVNVREQFRNALPARPTHASCGPDSGLHKLELTASIAHAGVRPMRAWRRVSRETWRVGRLSWAPSHTTNAIIGSLWITLWRDS